MLNGLLSAFSYLAIGGVILAGLWIMLEMMYLSWGPAAACHNPGRRTQFYCDNHTETFRIRDEAPARCA